ncbi:MAG: hypothetical protein KAT48_02340 [Bacteroidales bacterium]|nr:hypothetical protein [Bacteroidales bacterium]
MKKFVLINSIIALMFLVSSCEDYQLIMDELEDQKDAEKAEQLTNVNKVPVVPVYTLTEDDYALSTNSDIAEFMNFSASATPEEFLGLILDIKFLGSKGDQMRVTYDYYRGSNDKTKYIKDPVEYELTDADYDAMGTASGEPGKYNNFSSSTLPGDFLPDWLATTYPNATEEASMKIIYEYYAGGTDTRYSLFYKLDGVWQIVDVDTYELSSDDYDSMGEPGNYNNFSFSVPHGDYLPVFLKLKFPYATEGDSKVIMYKYYSSSSGNTYVYAAEYFCDGITWAVYASTIAATSPFKFNGDNWVIVPPITYQFTTAAHNKEYTVTDDDYDAVGNGTYNNFESSDEVVQGKLITILKMSVEDAVIGDVYKVNYKYYVGGGVVEDRSMNFEVISEE